MYGKGNFSLHQELRKIKAALGDAEMLAVNTNVLDGKQITLGQLQDVCNAVPFLHQVRLVIVEGLLERFEPPKKTEKRANASKLRSDSGLKEWQDLGNYIDKIPATTVLILIDGELDNKKNTLFKRLSPLAKIKAFPELKGKYLQSWIRERITEGGGNASPKAINLLEQLIGSDLWNMSSEIDKLLAFSHGRLITEDDVKQVTSYTRESNIFALIDAILESRRKVAQHLLHRLLQEGVVPTQILVLIARQLRSIIMAKEMDQKLSRTQVMGRLGITSDYVFDKVLKQAKAYTIENLKLAYQKVLEADVAIKTGKYDGDLAVDLLVVELCA
jgi:DNA polymerase-3 subunit delta